MGAGPSMDLKIDDLKIGDLKIDPTKLPASSEMPKTVSQTTTDSYSYRNNKVPGNTIKPGWDAWRDKNHMSSSDRKHLIWSDDFLGGPNNSGARKAARTNSNFAGALAKDVMTADGVNHMTRHRYVNCGLAGNNCDIWPEQGKETVDSNKYDHHKSNMGPIEVVKVPIGLRTVIRHGKEPKDCSNNGKERLHVEWGEGDYSQYSKQLPEDIATGCAGGSSLPRGEYIKTNNGLKIQHDPGNSNWKTDECYLGGWLDAKSLRNKTNCLLSEVSPNVFCQMGDYMSSTDLCRNECGDVKQGNIPSRKGFCELGYNRLCRKRKGDPIKRDHNGKIVNSKFDYLIEDPGCKTFCGSGEDKRCKSIKDDVCSRSSEDWLKSSWIPEYCRVHWKTTPNRVAMDKVCKDELLDPKSPQNLFSGKGCGILCMGEGTDVDTEWCRFHKGQYCLKSDANMLTDECYHFCSEFPDICDDYLSGNSGMCNRIGIKTQEDLDKPVPGTLQNYSDWCGCMMPRQFYQDYADDIDKKFNSAGYSIQGQIDVSPECMYPQCKQGSIMTKKQQTDKKNGMCTDCVQIMLQTYSGGNFIDNKFASEQSATCGNIKQNALGPGDWNIAGTVNKFIKVFDNKSYCTYENTAGITPPNMTDKIPDGNSPVGLCELTPGFYKVREINKFVRVHSNGNYCIFPDKGFDQEKNEFRTIDSMSSFNTKDDAQCEPNVPPPATTTPPSTTKEPGSTTPPSTTAEPGSGTAEGNVSQEIDEETNEGSQSEDVRSEVAEPDWALIGGAVGGSFLFLLILFIALYLYLRRTN